MEKRQTAGQSKESFVQIQKRSLSQGHPVKWSYMLQECICIANFIPDLSHWPGVTQGKCVPIMNVEVNTQQQQWTPSVSSFPCSRISEWCILILPLGRDMVLDVMWTGVLQNASLANLPSNVALVTTSPVAKRCMKQRHPFESAES